MIQNLHQSEPFAMELAKSSRLIVFRSPNLADEFQSKDHESFLSLARAMYKSLLNCLTGLQIEGNIVVEVLQGIPYVFLLLIPGCLTQLATFEISEDSH